jgi:hypothetical protein
MKDSILNGPPCHDCESRHSGCHAECEDYRAWSEKHEADKARARKFDEAKDFQIRGMTKGIRAKERRTPR